MIRGHCCALRFMENSKALATISSVHFFESIKYRWFCATTSKEEGMKFALEKSLLKYFRLAFFHSQRKIFSWRRKNSKCAPRTRHLSRMQHNFLVYPLTHFVSCDDVWWTRIANPFVWLFIIKKMWAEGDDYVVVDDDDAIAFFTTLWVFFYESLYDEKLNLLSV